MSTWQELLKHRSITSIEALAERFGPEHFPAELHDRLRQAIDKWEGCRDTAKEDADFDPIRDEPAFADLIGR